MISKKLRPFGTSIFSEMTSLAIEHDAIKLAQGFPDFEGPPEIIELAHRAMRDGHNQYARSMGVRIKRHRVATIPPSSFYDDKAEGRRLLRFAFCKTVATLRAAGERLRDFGHGASRSQPTPF